MEVATIVLNYKNYNETIKCVENSLEIGIKSDIVIVDNCSPNKSYEVLKDYFENTPNVHILKTKKNGGYAYGNNEGIRYIIKKNKNVKYIVIQNPDVRILSESIYKKAIKVLASNNNIKVVSGLMIMNGVVNFQGSAWVIPDKKYVGKSIKRGNIPAELKISNEKKLISSVEVVAGCFFMFNTNIIDSDELFDENTFLYNEENILAIKLKNKGYSEALILDEYYIHDHDATENYEYVKKYFKNITKSNLYMLSKYYNANWLDIILYKITYLNYRFRIFIKSMLKLL